MSKWKIHTDIDHYFCTSTIVEWYPLFVDPHSFNIIIESLAYCRANKGLRIHGYVIMLNHIHFIISSHSSSSISDIMRDFKRHTSGELNKMLKQNNNHAALDLFQQAVPVKSVNQNYKVWQNEYHPISIENKQFFKQKLEYIHLNPVKKGYVVQPEHWLYFSARDYAGIKPTPLEIDCLF